MPIGRWTPAWGRVARPDASNPRFPSVLPRRVRAGPGARFVAAQRVAAQLESQPGGIAQLAWEDPPLAPAAS